MRTKRMPRCALVLTALAALFALPSLAEDDAGSMRETVATPAAEPPMAAQRSNPLNGKRLDSKALALRRGGTDIVSDQKLSGVVADNRAINVSSGANLISEGAFSNSSGLPVVIQNSGSNVLIQNATIVNIQVN